MAIIIPGIHKVKNHKIGNPDKYITSLLFKFFAIKQIFKIWILAIIIGIKNRINNAPLAMLIIKINNPNDTNNHKTLNTNATIKIDFQVG